MTSRRSLSAAAAVTVQVLLVTLEAPGTFTRPWTAAIPMWRTDLQVFEYACHGNYAMPHSLSGARAVESRAAGQQ